ncbi:hypothetical protein [Microcoleus sp. bin38.metabat.b11b12b14.051]|nr:hypothetical protein [Microcoleus sp. bin38.metabat.b11b12b14.051]
MEQKISAETRFLNPGESALNSVAKKPGFLRDISSGTENLGRNPVSQSR